MTNEEMWEPVRRDHQAILDAAGLSEVKLTFGYYKHGDHFRFEARLVGGTPLAQSKARKLLPFSEER